MVHGTVTSFSVHYDDAQYDVRAEFCLCLGLHPSSFVKCILPAVEVQRY